MPVELDQATYIHGNRKQDSGHLPDSIPYGPSCRLDILARADMSCVPDADDIPLPRGALSMKPSYRFRFPDHPNYDHQVTVTRSIDGIPHPPSRGRLAMLAAREMKKFLERCKKEGNSFKYGMDELYLLRIDRASKASLQPRFGILRR